MSLLNKWKKQIYYFYHTEKNLYYQFLCFIQHGIRFLQFFFSLVLQKFTLLHHSVKCHHTKLKWQNTVSFFSVWPHQLQFQTYSCLNCGVIRCYCGRIFSARSLTVPRVTFYSSLYILLCSSSILITKKKKKKSGGLLRLHELWK